jgi:alpha-galactosidase/6-phospho-beta-glucosidase family protein
MEEIEIPTEHLHETIHEKVAEGSKEKEGSWNMYVAISTALIAVLAAISGLMAGHHSNEALIQQIKASDQWAYYQAKGIKAEIRTLSNNNIQDKEAIERYKKEQETIKQKAESAEKESDKHLAHHVLLASSVTLFQIAIAGSAIAILTKKKILWYGSLLVAAIGAIFFILGLI